MNQEIIACFLSGADSHYFRGDFVAAQVSVFVKDGGDVSQISTGFIFEFELPIRTQLVFDKLETFIREGEGGVVVIYLPCEHLDRSLFMLFIVVTDFFLQ